MVIKLVLLVFWLWVGYKNPLDWPWITTRIGLAISCYILAALLQGVDAGKSTLFVATVIQVVVSAFAVATIVSGIATIL